jgi:hypothetical protein
MDIEVLIGILGVFTSGIGIGVGSTLFTQWAHKKLTWQPPERLLLPDQEQSDLQGDLEDLTKAVLNLNQRVEFQEQLIVELYSK